MAKAPRPGAVKTRLAAELGAAAACDLYAAFLRDLHARLGGGPWRLLWAVDPPGAELAAVLGAEVACIDQRGAGLAERMANCFTALLAIAPAVVMIGADVPHLRPEVVEAAFAALRRCDVALVPTRDGGYAAIGLRRPVDLFTGIPMSTPEVCRRTIERAAALGLRVEAEDQTFDIDEVDDLRALAGLIRRGEVRLPFTAAALLRLGFL
jgi:rSAM/selenodomain-associated transferase 1